MKKSHLYIITAALIGIAAIAASFINIDLQEKEESSVSKYDFSNEPKIKGLTLVAPPRPFSDNPMPYIKSVNAEWIAVIPYGFIPGDGHKVSHGSERQWWGEREEGVVETITKAHESGLKVMIKPQIWIHDSWIGDFTLDNELHWKEWEDSYSDYLLHYARIAQEHKVDMICIGTEFKKAMQDNVDYWYRLIDQVRDIYDGALTYSSNWDEYKDVPIWDKLDYIGISAYFPLTEEKLPSHAELKKQWKPVVKELDKFANKQKKKIIFTEFGYLSVDGCAGKTWILEKERDLHDQNQQAQADAFHCLFATFWDKDWWAGGFFWKWYPEMRPNRKDFYMKDYSPQGKLAEKTITEWYSKN